MSKQILFVDDDANLLAGCQRTLRKDFSIDVALGGAQGLELIASQGPYAVVVADMQMPGMNGIEFLAKVEARSPDSTRIMLTGNADQKTARDALNQGHIFRFLSKPCPPVDLAQSLKAGLEQHRLITSERELLERTLNGGVKMLTDILSMLDPSSFGRGQRLRDTIRPLASSFAHAKTWELELAAMLSQIGLVTIPSRVLERFRAGHALTGPERDMLNRVPQIGSDLLSNVPRLEPVAAIVLYQNKNFDGTGFPLDPIAGEQIPIGARILHVLNDLFAFEDKGTPKSAALERMAHQAGKYDPAILKTIADGVQLPELPNTLAKAPPVVIDFKDLQVGAILASDLLTLDGMLIVPAGAEVSPTMLEKLRNFAKVSGIQSPIHIENCRRRS